MTITIDHLPSRTIQINGSEYLFFSGTSYLGMGHQPAFRAALMEGIDRYGTIFSASRNNNLQLKIYEEAEDFIAQWTGAEVALTVSSGFAAGQLAVQSLVNHKFIYAPSVHPAIWQPNYTSPREIGMQAQYNFENYIDFAQKIVSIVEQENEPIALACNAIDPLHGEVYDFSWIKNLPSDKPITLLLDDSHGIGITGTSRNALGFCEEGGGIFSEIKKLIGNQSNITLIVIASLAKAVGIPGGVILSDKKTIAMIRRNPLFVGASPIVPAYLFAFLQSQDIYSEARRVLLKNIQQFRAQTATLTNLGMTFLPDYPVVFVQHTGLFEALWQQNILISSFAYPKPNDPPITRIILSALHTEDDISVLTGKLIHELTNFTN
jgi:7-keto-8-aminopelargonate synthetase-like enzyme